MKMISLNGFWKIRMRKPAQIVCVGCTLLVFFFGAFLLCADDVLNVKRENEKTVYAIGASDEKDTVLDTHSDKEKTVHSVGSNKTKKDEEAKDRERSWDMLKSMGIVIDSRQDKHHSSKDQRSQTSHSQQQPAPAK